eukprot:5935029-Amphidinium_carterae.1
MPNLIKNAWTHLGKLGGDEDMAEQHFRARTLFRSVRGGLVPETQATHKGCVDECMEHIHAEMSLLEEDEMEDEEYIVECNQRQQLQQQWRIHSQPKAKLLPFWALHGPSFGLWESMFARFHLMF